MYNRDDGLALATQRRRLPIFRCRDAILYLVETRATVVLVGQTGCGKTTQVPQYLAEAGWCAGGRLVACTLIDFKGGGATQKVLVNSLRVGVRKGDGAGTSGEAVAFSEFTRSTLARILAPGDTRNFP